MKQQGIHEIRILAEDEQSLYTPLSPDDEFSEPVKTYIRSKLLGYNLKHQLKLTVISSSPLDEEKFKSATANWVKDEKAVFDRKERYSTILPTVMFIIGGLVVVLMSLLRKYFDPIEYAVIVIIGTAVMGRGVTNWYEHVPAIRTRKWLTNEIEKTSTIVFEYEDHSSVKTKTFQV